MKIPFLSDYLEYAIGVSHGIEAVARRVSTAKFTLRGPAGLFKSIDKHQFCYGLLEMCNANLSTCPIDIITFHRKGMGAANEILEGTIKLIEMLHRMYPNLRHMPYANSEADPSSGWSKNVSGYADVQYAQTLISTVVQHWNANLKGDLSQLESISHDNSFLSYHPFEFEQRTLLSRFVMNNTQPKSVVFIQKPVYAALGLLSSLASRATEMITKQNISYLISMGDKYAAVLLFSNDHNQVQTINIKWNGNASDAYGYFAEYLDERRTNPYSVWLRYGKPPYPNETVLSEMLHAQVSSYVSFHFD